MTLEDRLCLARAGYSAQDIAGFEQARNFAQQDPKPDQQDPKPDQQDPKPDQQDPLPEKQQDPKPEKQPADNKPVWAAALEKSIADLTKAMQANNRQFIDMGDPETPMQQAENALAEYVTGKPKSNNGGKKK